MSALAHILVVDDEPVIRSMVQKYLTKEGYRVSTADGGAAMRRVMERDPADLIILDLNMPEEHGFSLLTQIRKTSKAGVIILTGSQNEVDQVVGLELGSDDYISKSGDMRQLLARVRSVLRRVKSDTGGRTDAEHAVLEFEGWRLELSARRLISPGGTEVRLTTAEFDILAALAGSANRVLNRDQLMNMTKNHDWSAFDRSIDNSISRLRRKIEADPKNPRLITTVRGVGYVFTPKIRRV